MIKYVIMRYGDELTLNFTQEPLQNGIGENSFYWLSTGTVFRVH